MSDLTWLPGIPRIPGNSSGTYTHPIDRIIWHTTEGSSIAGAVGAYRANNSWPHLTWNPKTGDMAQHLSFQVPGRALKNKAGGVQTNTYGAIQVEVVGRAAEPFTNLPALPGLEVIRAAWRALAIPDRWPAGPPVPYPVKPGYPQVRDKATWLNFGGHYGHSQVPENDHGDPGAIDINIILGLPTNPDEEEEVKFADNGFRVENKGTQYAAVQVGDKSFLIQLDDGATDLGSGFEELKMFRGSDNQLAVLKQQLIYVPVNP